jgi:hypothetical protein
MNIDIARSPCEKSPGVATTLRTIYGAAGKGEGEKASDGKESG